MKLSLTIALFTLIIAAPALAETVKGDPNAVTCLQAQPLPNMAMVSGKEVCRTNAEWVRINLSGAINEQGQPISTLGPGGPLALTNR